MSNKFYNLLCTFDNNTKKNFNTISKKTLDKMKRFFEENCEYAQFIPVRKDGLFNKGPIIRHQILKSEDLEGYHALAVLPNEKSLAVLDIDSCEEKTKNLRQLVRDNLSKLLVVYHDSADLSVEEVILNKRFKVLTRPSNELKSLHSLTTKLSKLQIELGLKGHKPFSILGRHRSEQTEYKMLGGTRCIADLSLCPESITNCLKTLAEDEFVDDSCSHFDSNTLVWKNVSQNHFENAIREFVDYKTAIFKEEKHQVKVILHCPNKSLHTTVSHPSNFRVIYSCRTRSVYFSCFHKSCLSANISLGNRLFKNNSLSTQSVILPPINSDALPKLGSASYGGICWDNVGNEDFHLALQALPDYGKQLVIKTPDCLRFVCSCPNSHLHVLSSEPIDFSISYFPKTRQAWYGCRHNKSCFSENLKLGLEVFRWKKPK